jgi:succinyl-diaminopimelate desuccinylase
MKDKIFALTSQLVQFKSYEGLREEKRAIFDFVSYWFQERAIALEKFDHEEHPSILVDIPGDANTTILFLAHLDVVSASDEMFIVKREADIMRGRGVLDNKGVVAMLMLLAERIKKSKGFPNVKILFTTDEEIGGINGAGRVANLAHFKNIDFIIAPDGGLPNKIIYKEKGMLQLELEVQGKSGHGAKPWLANNPIEKAFSLYQKIDKLLAEEKKEANWYSTVSLTRLVAGREINRIPDIAEMSLDIRYTEEHQAEELLEKIKLFFDDSIKIKKMHIHRVLHSDIENQHIQNYHKIMQEELREEVSIEGEHSGSDAAHFMPLGIPMILHRANGGDGHSEAEWACLASFEKMMIGLEKFLRSY